MLNFIAIALAATGMMGPMAGALVHNAGSVAVALKRTASKRRDRRLSPNALKARMTAVTETIPVSAVFSVGRAKGVRRVYIF